MSPKKPKSADDVPHVEAEIVDDMRNGNGGGNLPYKLLRIPEEQIPSVLGLEPKPAITQRWYKWLFIQIDAQIAIELLRHFLRKK